MSLRSERANQLDKYLVNSCLKCHHYNDLFEKTREDSGLGERSYRNWRDHMKQEVMKCLKTRQGIISCRGCRFIRPIVAKKLGYQKSDGGNDAYKREK